MVYSLNYVAGEERGNIVSKETFPISVSMKSDGSIEVLSESGLVSFRSGGCNTVYNYGSQLPHRDSGKYEKDLDSERERMEFRLAGEPGDGVRGYLSEGVRLDVEYHPERDMHVVTSGDDNIGYIDRRDARRYEEFSPTDFYIKAAESVSGKNVITMIAFK